MRCLYVCILWHTLLLYHACHPPPPDFLMIRPEYGCVQKKRTGLTRVLLHTRYSIVGHTRGQHSIAREILGRTRAQHSIAREASISSIFGVSRPGVHVSARFFFVSFPLARLTRPPPGAASATARVVSWGRVERSKRSPYHQDGTA